MMYFVHSVLTSMLELVFHTISALLMCCIKAYHITASITPRRPNSCNFQDFNNDPFFT